MSRRRLCLCPEAGGERDGRNGGDEPMADRGTFLCAIVWKGVLAPDYLDARFFRVTLVTDERFAGSRARSRRPLGHATPRPTVPRSSRCRRAVEALDGPDPDRAAGASPPRARVDVGRHRAREAALAWAFLIAWPAATSSRPSRPTRPCSRSSPMRPRPSPASAGCSRRWAWRSSERRQHALRRSLRRRVAVVTIYAETPLVAALLGAISAR